LNVTLSGPAAADFKVIGFSPKVLAPGDSFPFEVSFTPSAVGGRTATLTVSSDDPDLPTWSVTLSGEGINRMDPVVNSAADVPLRTPAFSGEGKTFGSLTLGFAPAPGTILTVVDRTDNNPIGAFFDDLPDGGLVSATFGGQTYVFTAGYGGGSGNDLTLTLSSAGTPSLLNHPDFTGGITALAVRPDGSMLIGGNLFIPGNTKNRYLLMLRPDGTLVESFRPRFSYSGVIEFSRILPYPDGRFLVFGRFDAVNEVARRNIVRFNADGTVDPSFQIGEFPYRMDLDLMPDGRVLAKVNANAGAYITRYESNGDPDASFTPSRTGITNFLRLRDGKILINGDFGQNQGYHRLLRLEADGTPDASFSPPAIEYHSLGQMMEQRDGRVLVITSPGTNASTLRRLNADGSLDDTFQPYFGTSPTFKSFVEQADGKVIVGGNFSQLDGFQVRGVVRLFRDGTRDASFSGSATQIDSLAMLADGGIIASGSGIGGVSTIRLCRLLNNVGSFSAEIPQPDTIRLSATGAVPDPSWVAFSVLPSGAGWTPLGPASLTEEGWEVSGQTLPSSGIIHWVGHPSACSLSASLTDGFMNFGSAEPVLALSGPDGVVQPDGSGVISFGKMFPGQSRVLPITISNSGDGVWLPGYASISGPDAQRFSIVSSPHRGILPGESGTFIVSFTPQAAAACSASLLVSGNQTTGNPYVLQLSGTGSTTLDPFFHSASDVQITSRSFSAASLSLGTLRLGFAPTAGTQLRVINNNGTEPISGIFTDLADGSVIQAIHEGTTYDFLVGYRAGDGNDLVLALRGPGVRLAGYSAQVTGSVSIALPQDDGGALIGGLFTQVNGVPRAGIAKLDAVGGTVPGFSPSATGAVSAAVELPGGDHLLAGLLFPRPPGTDMNDVARLTADGVMKPLARANNTIQTMAVQKDGGILIGGGFTSVSGVSRSGFARLHPSGALDRSFSASPGNNVSAILVQPDGRILVAAPSYTHLSRLLPTGALDPSFTSPFANNFSGAPIAAMVSLADGRIIIGGSFDRVGGVLCAYLARLHPDGSLDTSFRPRLDARVRTLALQADGSIIAGGDFTEVNDVARNRLVRISSDGSVDGTFDPNAGDRVSSVAVAKDGRVFVCGSGLSTLSGAPSSNFAALGNQPAISSIQISPGKVTWLRSGTAPEAVSAVFEIRGAGDAGWRVLGEGALRETARQMCRQELKDTQRLLRFARDWNARFKSILFG
ncbi:MAG: choice-of-anchor D domain-containing protein, partial [Verrucomicrobiaceae bacterium]